MLNILAHTIIIAAGILAAASIVHTTRTTAPAVRALIRQAKGE
jgi:hypothetical protein